MTAAFDRLAPFIQEFIWKRGWTDLRDIQTAALGAVFDTDDHLLAAGTAKAAFLLHSRLRIGTPGPGYLHFPDTTDRVFFEPPAALGNDAGGRRVRSRGVW